MKSAVLSAVPCVTWRARSHRTSRIDMSPHRNVKVRGANRGVSRAIKKCSVLLVFPGRWLLAPTICRDALACKRDPSDGRPHLAGLLLCSSASRATDQRARSRICFTIRGCWIWIPRHETHAPIHVNILDSISRSQTQQRITLSNHTSP